MHETANKFLTIDLTPDCRLMIIKCVIPQLDKQIHFLQLKIYVSQGNHYHHNCGNNILLARHFYITVTWITLLSSCCASSIILWLSQNIYLTWFSVGLFAAGLSSTYPTAFSFAQKFVTISGKFASRFAIGGAIGWMTIPSIAGYFFERYCKSMPLIG